VIKCNLSKLMGIHKMTIQDVHDKTGLNRNTISNLYHEKVTRIDFETMDKLCKLFGCQPGPNDLFESLPDDKN
jgi:putative transcriptional regulator